MQNGAFALIDCLGFKGLCGHQGDAHKPCVTHPAINCLRLQLF